MKKELKIFVIIVTYKGKQWYDKCFRSLRESTIPVQTIVVDNSPGEDDAAYIKEHFPEIHLIKTKENLGFGKANNLGMRYALDNGCDYVFLLNQDTWIKNDTISIMLPIAEQYPECGVFSPMHMRADEKSLYIEIEDGTTDHATPLLSDCYFQTLKDIYKFHYVNAAAWFIPRATLERVGGFDPIFFVYGEDDNYLHRVEYHKMWVGLIPKAQIIHDHQKETLRNDLVYLNNQIRLVQYVNILKPFSVERKLFYWLRKLLMYSTLLYNQEKKQNYMHELAFLWKHRKEIKKSRKNNIMKGETWL